MNRSYELEVHRAQAQEDIASDIASLQGLQNIGSINSGTYLYNYPYPSQLQQPHCCGCGILGCQCHYHYHPATNRELHDFEILIERSGDKISLAYGPALRLIMADPIAGVDLRNALASLQAALKELK